MADLLTPIPTPDALVVDDIQLDDVGLDTNVDAYNHMIRPSFTNVIGSGTLQDGGYIGRVIDLYRSHIYDMKQRKEISSADVGRLLSNIIPQVTSECIAFESNQIHSATKFTHDLLEIEKQRLDVRRANIGLQSDVFSHTNLNPIAKLKAMEDVQASHVGHTLTEAELVLKNIEAGGDGVTDTINSDTSLTGYRIKESIAKVGIDTVVKQLHLMEAGGDGVTDSIEYQQSLIYLNRLKAEAQLGNTGNGINLDDSIFKWDTEKSKILAKHESIKAGGDGDTILVNAEDSLEYLNKLEVKARLGDEGGGVDLSNSVYHWENVKSSILAKMESIKAGGNGEDILVNADESIPYYQKLEISSKLGDRGNGINLNDSLYKYQSDKLHAEAALESVRAGGDGVNVISDPLKALPYYQTLEISSKLGDRGNGIDLTESVYKYDTDRAKSEAVLSSIKAGGNGDDISVDATNTLQYFQIQEMKSRLGDEGNGIVLSESLGKFQTDTEEQKSLLTKVQAASESIRAGGNGDTVLFNADTSTAVYQRDLLKAQKDTEEANVNLVKGKAALVNIEAGGDGISADVWKVNSTPYMNTMFKKMQALSEMQRGGYATLEGTDTVDDSRSMVVAQRESMIVQKDMYARQTEAFDDRKRQAVLDATLKYNMMVFPDNELAGEMIPTSTDKDPIDRLISEILEY